MSRPTSGSCRRPSPGYDEGITVPTMVEVATGRAVTKNSPLRTLDF